MPRPPRMTKRRIPRSPEEYQNEIDGIQRYLAQLRGVTSPEGQWWVKRQRTYYEKRLTDLMCYPPPSVTGKRK